MPETDQLIIELKAIGDKETAAKIEELTKKVEKMEVGASASFTKLSRSGTKMSREVITATHRLHTKTGKHFIDIRRSIGETETGLRRFKMEWLSIMFFSMNMQRSLQKIMKSGITTFMKIAGETNKANQTLVSFGAQINYIRFTLGRTIAEALEPFLPIFIKFVEKMVDFIEQHPEEVFWGLATALGVFTAGATIGQFMLFAGGVAMLMDKIDPTKLAAFSSFLRKLLVITGIAISFEAITEPGLSFENIIAPVLIGWGLKSVKAGVWAFTITLAIEFILDPKATTESIGKFVAKFINLLGKFVDIILALVRNAKNYIIAKITGREFRGEDIFAGISEAYRIAFEKELIKLREKGELSKSIEFLAFEWGYFEREIAEGFKDSTKAAEIFGLTSENVLLRTLEKTEKLGKSIGSSTKGSFPLVYSLIQVQIHWIKMREIAVAQISAIITKLNQIPREIVTIHKIITVYESRGRRISGYQVGTEYVPRTGIYQLHQGEKIIPANQISTTNNINITTQTNTSVQEIANIISKYINENLRRYI